MSKTKAELTRKWIEQAEDGKYPFEKAYFQEEREKKRKHYDSVVKPEEDRQKAKDAKDPIKDKTYWELVKHEAHSLINDNFQGYNDWAIAMSGLVHIAMLLSKAMWYDPPELTNLIPHASSIGGTWTGVKRQIYDKVVGGVGDWARKGSVDADKLPGVAFNVSLNAQGKLVTEVTVDGGPERENALNKSAVEWAKSRGFVKNNGAIVDDSGKPMTPLKLMIDIGFTAWAAHRGYELDRTGVFKDANGNQLTNDKLIELNNENDPNLKFTNFIKGGFMPAELTLGPRP